MKLRRILRAAVALNIGLMLVGALRDDAKGVATAAVSITACGIGLGWGQRNTGG